jgi:ADP-dependent NAD(P)H-hydrate dehydratase / NAD(P)H-hydrate epimerase
MKILSAEQVRAADRYTSEHEPVASIDLMERAASECVDWVLTSGSVPFSSRRKTKSEAKKEVFVFCGTGNNGGDGLAMARLLLKKNIPVQVFIIQLGNNPSKDFLINKKRLEKISAKSIKEISSGNELPRINKNGVVIDALFGTGLSRKPEGLAARVIAHINRTSATIISIDMPSGLFADVHTPHAAVVRATETLSFQTPKLAFLFAENEKYVGNWHILDIGLDKSFIESLTSENFLVEKKDITSIIPARKKFSHKGTYGHALIAAGSYGMMGAAVLCTRASIHSGAGLVTAFIPKCGYNIMQRSVPEAMAISAKTEKYLSGVLPDKNFTSITIGSGISKNKGVVRWLKHLLSRIKLPILLDADALNIISENKSLLKKIPAGTALTPHPGEFRRLAGKTKNDFENFQLLKSFAKKYKLCVVLKGAYTCIATPEGEAYFNTTGNPGMAKGGSGDVLSGIIGALLARGMSPLQACMTGVYIHGLAGDIAAQKFSQESMTASDIINFLPEAFKQIR